MARQKQNALQRQVGGSHYQDYAIQPLEFVHKNEIPAVEAMIIKYICRHQDKGGVEDLEKAKHLIDYLIENDYE